MQFFTIPALQNSAAETTMTSSTRNSQHTTTIRETFTTVDTTTTAEAEHTTNDVFTTVDTKIVPSTVEASLEDTTVDTSTNMNHESPSVRSTIFISENELSTLKRTINVMSTKISSETFVSTESTTTTLDNLTPG